ncbi:hypothetical protein [Weissella confusa]|uniref:hypothetical protein n=1 Tax=Weissella confusa TaxID=1583 RepID=UPI001081264E|nr:hypothetical protein [Weissella confusa]MBJ7653966.1 hypothetical protein [Weissella confusa]TGE44889.1 hypothetical protein C6P24_02055 [Weissella confusa]
MTAYLSKGFETIQYNVIDGNPRQDFMDLVSMTEHHTKALNGTDEEVESFKPEMLNVVYGTVDGHYRTDQLVNRSVMFIDVDDGGDYDTVLERVTGGILNGTNMVIYPTISNQIKPGTRLRIGIELSREVAQAEYSKVWSVLTAVHELEADVNGVTQNWNQLAGTYTLTSQNSVHAPYIKSDGQPLDVDAFVQVYDNEPNKFRIKAEEPAVTATFLTNGSKPWSVMASKVLNAMLDPEAHYKEFGGFDNMLVSVAGWLFRQTNSIEITANWVEQVNATGSDPLPDKELKAKFISWSKNFK